MKKVSAIAACMVVATLCHAASGIFGGYFTIDGTKHKSSSLYGGTEPTFDGKDFGSYTQGSDTLILDQAETLAFADSGSTVFAFAFAYRVRASADPVSTNPGDYIFLDLGNGVGIGGNDSKGEVTSQNIDLLTGLSNGNYALDVIHKVGANDGGSNFEWLASKSSHNPGDTVWGDTDAFSGSFEVVPEPASALLLGLGALGLTAFRRRR